jgi:long-chain fatty acid transport protein
LAGNEHKWKTFALVIAMNLFRLTPKRVGSFLSVVALAATFHEARGELGTILTGAGPSSRSVGGAGTAAPWSASNTLYWNPATMTGYARSELEVAAELLFPHSRVTSQFSANAFGPGIPPISLAGSSRSDAGAYPLPTISLIYVPEDSPLTFGLGIFALAGFGTNYAGTTTNPLLSAPAPAGFGVGAVFSEYQVLQISPSVAYKVTDHFSIAAGPTLNLAALRVDPGLFAAPDDANADGFATYPAGTHSQTTWGAGFILGAYYHEDTWAVGASIKSPQWFDTFRYNSKNEVGGPRNLTFELDLPLVVSVGVSYSGLEHWVFAADVRYADYANANGFGDQGYAPDGSVKGLGWKSIFGFVLGAQYQMTDALSLRLGYCWSESPVPTSESFFNTVSPLLMEHTVHLGATFKVTEDFSLLAAYVHGFENTVEASLPLPTGPVLGTSVKNAASADSILFGVSVKFGGATCPAKPLAIGPEHCVATPTALATVR